MCYCPSMDIYEAFHTVTTAPLLLLTEALSQMDTDELAELANMASALEMLCEIHIQEHRDAQEAR